MTPMGRTEHHFGPFWEKDFGAISGGPFFSRPLCFIADKNENNSSCASGGSLHGGASFKVEKAHSAA